MATSSSFLYCIYKGICALFSLKKHNMGSNIIQFWPSKGNDNIRSLDTQFSSFPKIKY